MLTFETNLLEEIDLARLLPEILPVVDVGRVRLDAGARAALVVDQEAEALLRRPAPEICRRKLSRNTPLSQR